MTNWLNKVYCGDALEVMKEMPDDFVDTICSSPPYWGLRDYQTDGQLGLEPTLDLYLDHMAAVTAELRRVLKPTGVLFWNHGDCYGGSWQNYGAREGKQRKKVTESFSRKDNPTTFPVTAHQTAKCLAVQNYRLILRMIDEQGWILRNSVVWHKPNSMPSSVKDRFSNAYEPIFMLVKQKKYWFDLDAVRMRHDTISEFVKRDMLKRKLNDSNEQYAKHSHGPQDYNPAGKNPGDVWRIPTQPFPDAHFATFPEKLIEPMIKAACPKWICPKCGKARVRMVENQIEYGRKNLRQDARVRPDNLERPPSNWQPKSHHTLGWTSCSCNDGWEAGIILDPFMGSGTVGVVAKKLGRQFVGIELNPDYCKMAEERIGRAVYQEELEFDNQT